jgi:hypothetical protein
MSNDSRDIELLRQIDNDLRVQYGELLCLRAEVAGLLFPLKGSPPRKQRRARSNRVVQLNERPASSPPVLLVMPERHLT